MIPSRFGPSAIVGLLMMSPVVVTASCGGNGTTPDHDGTTGGEYDYGAVGGHGGGRGHGEEHGHSGEHDHGGGHGAAHAHTTPEALRPLMHDLRRDLGTLRDALALEDLHTAQLKARAIAQACDDQEGESFDATLFGPDFAAIDGELHEGAGILADHAGAGRLVEARMQYALVSQACVRCHQQAPTGQHVDLGPLVEPQTW